MVYCRQVPLPGQEGAEYEASVSADLSQILRIICAASANVSTDFPMTSCGGIGTNSQKLIFMTKQGIGLILSLWDYYEP